MGVSFHFGQCKLLSIYQDRTGIQGWFTAGHWQYLLWYVVFSLSTFSALAICIHATCCKRAHILRGDKYLGHINILMLMAIIIIHTFFSGGQEPWTDGLVEFKKPAMGLNLHCLFLYINRCLLIDATYVVSALLCVSWIALVTCTFLTRPLQRVSSITKLPNEKIVNRNKEQVDPTLFLYNEPPPVPPHKDGYPMANHSDFYYWQQQPTTPYQQSLSRHYVPDNYILPQQYDNYSYHY
ncbi:uncharacterized protein BX663DRAFT_527821 [Cokeromyces recurvatus]|uniref:uncharacterized protein n=1 Tax=Cokeromyces recurvatus TaxID=90255 RepID=UPI00221F57C3|nr:uncharacterized protein BX663DRAFT_527821 [Cokeromyces recurvatus]KAI7897558.1 hypothetical protein BX663DRAFT_527821 [Cokeromyces recurvatus]